MVGQAGKGLGSEGEAAPRLSPAASFVVQLGSETSIDDGRVCGRVEHVRSGTSEPFSTLAELLAFMKRHGTRGSDAAGPTA